MDLGDFSSFSILEQNIANKNMNDAYYSDISPSDTGLIILSVQSRDTLAC